MKFVLELLETEMNFFFYFYSVDASDDLIFFAIFTCTFHWKRNHRGPHTNCFQGSETVDSQCIYTWNIYFKMDENNYGGGGFSRALWLLTDAFSSADSSHTAWQQHVFFPPTTSCLHECVSLEITMLNSTSNPITVFESIQLLIKKKILTCKLLRLNVEVYKNLMISIKAQFDSWYETVET